MGRPNASPKQQFQSVSQSPAEVTDGTTSALRTGVDENQQESTGSVQLEVSGDHENGQNNQQQSHLWPHQAAISDNQTHQATTAAMAFTPQNHKMRSPTVGAGVVHQPPRANPQAFPPQPQAFPPSQDAPQAVFPPQPQSSTPSHDEPQAFPPQTRVQAFPPHTRFQVFSSEPDEPQAFPPQDGHHQPQAFPPAQDEPQAFPPAQDEPQAFPPEQGGQRPQAFPPQDGHHQPQAFPPAQDEPQAFPPPQATFQQQQPQNRMQFPQNANFFHPSTMGGGQMGAQPMPASPFHPTPQSMINNATPGFPVINQNHIIQVPTENWTSGLLECMNDPTNALVTACFPCVTFGQISEIIDSGQTSCATSGLLYGAIAFCIAMPCLMSCTYRTKLRSRYGLIETPAPDWVIHCFCECCALCQEYRELKERGLDPSIGWIGNLAKQKQMVQTTAMTPPLRQTMMG